MADNPLQSLLTYSTFIAELLDREYVEGSTVRVWSVSLYTGMAEGEIVFSKGYRLRLREEIDFDAELITSYGYEVYREQEKLYWYDDFPHPNDPTLASTFPHHKHEPPDIKRHRIPAPGISFSQPNLPLLVSEIEALVQTDTDYNE